MKDQLRQSVVLALTLALISTALQCRAARSDLAGRCGSGCTWSLNLLSGVLDVAGTRVESAPCSKYALYIRSVTFGSSVNTIESRAFSGCFMLESLVIPSYVNRIEDRAFSGCRSLVSVSLGSGINYLGTNAFSGCDKLILVSVNNDYSLEKLSNSLVFPSSQVTKVILGDEVTSIGDNIFNSLSSLEDVVVDEENPYFMTEDGVLFDKNGKTLIKCPARNSVTDYVIPNSVQSIANNAFYGCKLLKSVKIGNGVTSIGNSAFFGCSSLSHICYFGTEDPGKSSLNVFNGCNQLTDVSVTKYYTDNEFCGKMTSVDGTRDVVEPGYGSSSFELDSYSSSSAYYYSSSPSKSMISSSSVSGERNDGDKSGMIVGIIFGCFAFVAIVSVIIFCIIVRCTKNRKANAVFLKDNTDDTEDADQNTVPMSDLKISDKETNKVQDSNTAIIA